MKALVWAGLATLLFPTLVSDSTLGFSNSVLSLCAFAALCALLRHAEARRFSARLRKYAHALGLLFSVMTAFGYALLRQGAIPYGDPALIAAIAVFAHVFAQAIGVVWSVIDGFEARSAACAERPGRRAGPARLLRALYARPLPLFLLLLLCWAPCYISTFPGNFVYDASYEYYQRLSGYTRSYPLLHSVIITRLLYASELLTGSINAGVALYTVVQMLLLAALFTHILRSFAADGVHPALLGALTVYYAAFPAIHLLATCTTRDVLFSALLTWSVCLFARLARDPDAFMSSAKNVVLLAAVLAFTLLSRSNNSGPLMPLLLLAVCAAVGLCFGRKHVRHAALFAASSLGLFFAVNAALVALCQPLHDSPPSSSMSMLAQPVVRAYMLHGDAWPQEDREAFESYFNMETLEYFPQNADPAKGNLQVRYANMRPFLSFWVKIGLRHPACYMDAVLATTREMWFPASVIDGYRVRSAERAYEKDYFYFGQYIEEIGSRLNLLPAVFSFYERIGLMLSFEKIPMLSMLFSIGFQFWLVLHCAFHAAYRKCRRLFWPLAILLVYAAGSAFAPLVLMRYFAALFLAFPMTVVFTLYPGRYGARQAGA